MTTASRRAAMIRFLRVSQSRTFIQSNLSTNSWYNRRAPSIAPSIFYSESETAVPQDVMNCPRCRRRTAMARGTCIYCGEALPISRLTSAPPQRNLDAAEHAFNTILEPSLTVAADVTIAALAAALKIEASADEAIVLANKRLPIARSQTRQEAEMIAALVRNCGLVAFVVADQELAVERELTRAQ